MAACAMQLAHLYNISASIIILFVQYAGQFIYVNQEQDTSQNAALRDRASHVQFFRAEMFDFTRVILICVFYLNVLLKIGDAQSSSPPPAPSFWIPNVYYNGSQHNWTFYNGSWYNETAFPIPVGTNVTIVTNDTITTSTTTTTTTTTTTPKPKKNKSTKYPYWFPTQPSKNDPGSFNSVELGIRNRMYELRSILHYHFPRYSIFQFKNLTPKISLLPHDRYFEGPSNYALFFLAFATISIILILAYLLSIRCWGLSYPFLTMHLLRMAMIWIGLVLIFFFLVGICGHLMIWHCYHQINVGFLQGAARFLQNFVDRVGDCVDSVFKYIRDLEMKLRFIKASQEGEVNPYLQPDDMLVTTTIGPNLKDDMQKGGWSAIYDRIAGTTKQAASTVWSGIAKSIASSVWGITNDLKLMATSALSYLMTNVHDKMVLLEGPIQEFLSDLHSVLTIFYWFNVIDYMLTISGFLFFGYMIFLCMCIMRTVHIKKNQKMRCLSKFTIGMMIFWWILTMIIVPIAFIWVDFCFHPADSIADLVPIILEFYHDSGYFENKRGNKVRVSLDRNLIYYYLTCEGDDPLQGKMKVIILGLGYITRAMGTLLAGIQSFGRNSERVADVDEGTGLMMKIQHAQLEIFNTISAGCNETSKMFHSVMTEVCNPCLMGVILYATIAPIIATLFLFVVILALKMKNFIGLPIPGMNWKKYEEKQKKKELKRLKQQQKKLEKQEKRDNKLRQKMAEKLEKKAKKAEIEERKIPLKLARRRIKLLKLKRLKEIKRLKSLAMCCCVPHLWAIKKCPDECQTVPTTLPPISDPKQRQLELKRKIEEDKRKAKIEMQKEKISLAFELDADNERRKEAKRKAKKDAQEEKKRKKRLQKRLKKMREADDEDKDSFEVDEQDEEDEKQLQEAIKTCDATCRGIDRLRAMRAQKKLKKLRTQGRRKRKDVLNPTDCIEDECPKSKNAQFELDKALEADLPTVDLECGCRFGTKDMKRMTRGWWD